MVIWITGASTGIGRATALHYLGAGHSVIACARSPTKLQRLAGEAAGLAGHLYTFTADVCDLEVLEAGYNAAIADMGEPDCAILNAGTHVPTPVAELRIDDFRTLMDVNYMGVINSLSLAHATMKARGRGQIAIVASLAGYRGLPLASAYGASKAALINLAESMREEMALEGIDLRLVNPGFVKTPLTDLNDFPMPFLMPADEAALALARGLESRRFEIFFPRKFGFVMKLLRALPPWLLFIVSRRMLVNR